MNPAIMIRSIQSKISFNATSLAQAYPEYSQPNDPNIFYETKNFTVKLVSTRKEYMKIQKLRYNVFHREFGNKKFPLGFDKDRYDDVADHLLVIDKSCNKIVGGYRLISSQNPKLFYSASEFSTEELHKLKGSKVELSRACIHKNYRNGTVLNLLWKGVGAYCIKNGGDWLLGIPSIKTTCPSQAARIYNYFYKKGYVSEEIFVKALPSHALVGLEQEILHFSGLPFDAEAKKDLNIPPLFLSYIKAGAKVIGTPAVDTQFSCIDFPVALNMRDMAEVYRKKFYN